MSDVILPSGLPGRHVVNDPLDAIGLAAHCSLGPGSRFRRQVEHRNVPQPQPKSMGGEA